MTHLLPGGSYKYSFIAIIVTYDLLICNKNEKGSDFSLPLNLAEAAVDCKHRFASGSLGMRPASLLSSLALANQRARASMGLSHPLRGFSPPRRHQQKNKKDIRLDVFLFLWRRIWDSNPV